MNMSNDWQIETVSEPRLRQQAGIEKSQTPVERDILVQWVINSCTMGENKTFFYREFIYGVNNNYVKLQ